jgi:hypothetical protein
METLRTRAASTIVHKTTDNGSAYRNAEPASPTIDNDTLIDGIAGAMAQMRQTMRAEYEARISMLEGKVEALLTLLGSDNPRAKSVRNKRHADVSGLLEDHRNNS